MLNELKKRGVKDILVIYAYGLTGMKEDVAATYPQTEFQRRIVNQIRNTLKYVGEKNKKEFANDLKTIKRLLRNSLNVSQPSGKVNIPML